MENNQPRRAALLTAAAAMLAALASQCLTVYANYHGQWTALFCVGETYAGGMNGLPPAYVFSGSNGYDGQMYRVVAHDPWLKTDLWRSLDGPEHRYRRILMPALAWLLAGGRTEFIDAAYIALVLGFLGLGVYFLGLWLAREGLPAWTGAAFLLLPGVLISLDRMTPDIALYALTAALLSVWRGRLTPAAVFILAIAPLVRDLGVLLVAAAAASLALEKRWKQTGFALLCILPYAAWLFWLRGAITTAAAEGGRGAGLIPRWALQQPVSGLLIRLSEPLAYPSLAPGSEALLQILDFLGWCGMALAVVLGVASWRQWRASLAGWLLAAQVALFPLANSPGLWADSHSYPRAYTPLLGLLALEAWRRRQWWWALPLFLVTLRVLVPFARQGAGIAMWLAAG